MQLLSDLIDTLIMAIKSGHSY